MPNITPTIDRFVDEAIVYLVDAVETVGINEPGVGEPGTSLDSLITEAAGQTVPCVTSELFALVVNDNALGFLDCPGLGEKTPFEALAYSIQDAVADDLRERINGLIPEHCTGRLVLVGEDEDRSVGVAHDGETCIVHENGDDE